LLHTQVEKKPPTLIRLVQWVATFVATCTAVMVLT